MQKKYRILNNEQNGGAKILSNDNIKLKPVVSKSKNFINLEFPNIKVSQVAYKEGPVGMTFIHFINGAKVHMEVRGGWPAYINMLSTNDKHMTSGINISGGSILGLESTTGIVAESVKYADYNGWMDVNGAIIYSSNLNRNKIYPDKALGRFAFNDAMSATNNKLYNGQVGAGLSASHGQGWGYREINGIKILALVVNNAIGNVYKNNKVIHKVFDFDKIELNKNTTIIVVITNLDLDNDELQQMNHQLNVSIGDCIKPFNTLTDGDIFYTCSTQEVKNKYNMIELIKFFSECTKVLHEAIYNTIL